MSTQTTATALQASEMTMVATTQLEELQSCFPQHSLGTIRDVINQVSATAEVFKVAFELSKSPLEPCHCPDGACMPLWSMCWDFQAYQPSASQLGNCRPPL